jgi:glycosyltransferase involved in cell wall biosynthesis
MVRFSHKITIDVRMLDAYGIGTYIRNLVPMIISALPEIRFNLLGDKSELQKLSWTSNSNVDLIHCNSPIYSISEQFELPLRIPESDLFWSPHYNIPFLSARTKKRVVTIHDVFHLVFFNRLNLPKKIYSKTMLNLATRYADKIITVSNFSESEIMRHIKINRDKIKVINNAVNTDIFKALNGNAPNDINKKLVPPEKYILYVGNIKFHKNIKNLILAYEHLLNKGITDCYLVIVGEKERFIAADSNIRDTINSPSKLSEKIIFTGYMKIDDLSVLYNSASLFVFPSLYEGFGLPPLEAMACKCPVVVSNTASLPEVCGDAAYYVDPHSVDSIAEGIQNVLSDNTLRESLIKRGLERVKLFSWERSAEEHLKIFEEVLSN